VKLDFDLNLDFNFAKLNHILIPPTKAGRDRFRRGLFGKLTWPVVLTYESLSEEGRVLAVLSLIVGGFGQDVRNAEIYVLWCALIGLLAGSLAVRWLFAMEGVHAKVNVAKRVTIGDELVFELVVRNEGTRDHYAVRVGGPFLPWDGKWSGPGPRIQRLAAGAEARVEMRARFIERGEHHLDPFRAAALVPLGLAQGRRIVTTGCRFLVVPRIANVVRITMPVGRRHQPGGVALASKTGESMDLLGVRPYRVGDPIRDLHARSWARLGQPVVREYQEEYFSRIGIIVDIDAGDARRLEAAISLAAGVVAHLSRGEALIDLLVVGDRVHDLTLGRSLGFLEQALDLLACVEAGKRATKKTQHLDREALLGRISVHLPRISCIVVVALDDDRGAFAERIRGYGVGCVTLHVVRPGEAPARDGRRDLRRIAADAIERGEALSL
jgi:uncharacterized protein (DUF58 family)